MYTVHVRGLLYVVGTFHCSLFIIFPPCGVALVFEFFWPFLERISDRSEAKTERENDMKRGVGRERRRTNKKRTLSKF